MNVELAEAFNDSAFQKRVLWLNGALPALLLALDFWRGNLGANPPEAVIRTSGVLAILFLLLTLTITPVAKIWKQNWLIRHRRWLGLWSFYYALLHFIAYALFDKALDWSAVGEDVAKRPFILLGALAFFILLPLAITSNNAMIRWMGGLRWKWLHRLTYVVVPIVVIHYWWVMKSDVFYPALFAGLFSILFVYRIFAYFR